MQLTAYWDNYDRLTCQEMPFQTIMIAWLVKNCSSRQLWSLDLSRNALSDNYDGLTCQEMPFQTIMIAWLVKKCPFRQLWSLGLSRNALSDNYDRLTCQEMPFQTIMIAWLVKKCPFIHEALRSLPSSQMKVADSLMNGFNLFVPSVRMLCLLTAERILISLFNLSLLKAIDWISVLQVPV
jgi:hypothetical protein